MTDGCRACEQEAEATAKRTAAIVEIARKHNPTSMVNQTKQTAAILDILLKPANGGILQDALVAGLGGMPPTVEEERRMLQAISA